MRIFRSLTACAADPKEKICTTRVQHFLLRVGCRSRRRGLAATRFVKSTGGQCSVKKSACGKPASFLAVVGFSSPQEPTAARRNSHLRNHVCCRFSGLLSCLRKPRNKCVPAALLFVYVEVMLQQRCSGATNPYLVHYSGVVR